MNFYTNMIYILNKTCRYYYFKSCEHSLRNSYQLAVINRGFHGINDVIASDVCNKVTNVNTLDVNQVNQSLVNLIICEYQYLRHQHSDCVPKQLTIDHIKQLMRCRNARKRGRNWIDNSWLERRKLLKLWAQLESNDGYNQIVLPIMSYQNEMFVRNRLRSSAMFGQNVVIDLSYDHFMSRLECKNCAEQLLRIFDYNIWKAMDHDLPYHLNIVNVDQNGWTKRYIDCLAPQMLDTRYHCNVTPKSYLDIFASEQLIYLSPHAEHVLSEYDHCSTFIIGGFVDRQKVIDISHEKSKRENIRCMRLPLDSLQKKHNIQSLDDVVKVLHDMKLASVSNNPINLERSIRKSLPKNKLKPSGQVAYEQLHRLGINLSDYCQTDLLNKQINN